MALTVTEIEEAIRRALLNGETWEMGDVHSHISLERLMELQEQANANAGGIEVHLASFQPVRAEAE